MRYKDVKTGAKVHFQDFDDEIGIIGEVDSEHYFMIDYPDKPKSILMNPYQAGYDELRDIILVEKAPK